MGAEIKYDDGNGGTYSEFVTYGQVADIPGRYKLYGSKNGYVLMHPPKEGRAYTPEEEHAYIPDDKGIVVGVANIKARPDEQIGRAASRS